MDPLIRFAGLAAGRRGEPDPLRSEGRSEERSEERNAGGNEGTIH